MEEPTPDDDVTVAPLAGFTVGITAARRAEELRTMLERRGAAVLHGPALRLVPLADDVELRAATEDLIARPPHVTLATTGIGFRSWIEAADAWGLGDGLLSNPVTEPDSPIQVVETLDDVLRDSVTLQQLDEFRADTIENVAEMLRGLGGLQP